MVPMRQSSGTSKHQEAPQLLHLVLLHLVELPLRTLVPPQVALVMDTEKAVATTTEEEEEEEEGLLMVEVVGLPVISIEVEEIGEAGHHNRDPKDTAG